MKSEFRSPKPEGGPNSEGANDRRAGAFGLRASDFFRISAFGFRISGSKVQRADSLWGFLLPLLTTLLVASLAGCSTASDAPRDATRDHSNAAPLVATFSIVGFDPETGDLGVAVQSKFFGVGSVVPWAKAGVGAIATQSRANVNYGLEGLALLQAGTNAAETLKQLTSADTRSAARQAGVVDARGNAASFTGTNCQPWAGHREGKHFCVQGNILAGPEVVDEMAKAFEAARKVEGSQLADWLVASLEAGQKAGGDKRGQQSAALLVVRDKAGYDRGNDRFIDLRVEDHSEPIKELARLLEVHKKFYAGAHKAKPVRR